jgi:hypothetical protein
MMISMLPSINLARKLSEPNNRSSFRNRVSRQRLIVHIAWISIHFQFDRGFIGTQCPPELFDGGLKDEICIGRRPYFPSNLCRQAFTQGPFAGFHPGDGRFPWRGSLGGNGFNQVAFLRCPVLLSFQVQLTNDLFPQDQRNINGRKNSIR